MMIPPLTPSSANPPTFGRVAIQQAALTDPDILAADAALNSRAGKLLRGRIFRGRWQIDQDRPVLTNPDFKVYEVRFDPLQQGTLRRALQRGIEEQVERARFCWGYCRAGGRLKKLKPYERGIIP